MAEFTRGFKLHTPDGDTFDGAAFPSGRHFVLDHPEQGLARAAVSMDIMLEPFLDGTRVEWADPGVTVPRAAFDLLVELALYTRHGGQTTPVGQRAADALEAAGLLPLPEAGQAE